MQDGLPNRRFLPKSDGISSEPEMRWDYFMPDVSLFESLGPSLSRLLVLRVARIKEHRVLSLSLSMLSTTPLRE
jgi:hypothetical protein